MAENSSEVCEAPNDFEFSKDAPTFQHAAAQEVMVIPGARQRSSSARSDFEPASPSVK